MKQLGKIYAAAPVPTEMRKTSVAEFQADFSKNVLKNLITNESSPVALHREKTLKDPVAKPLERKEVETAILAQTKTL